MRDSTELGEETGRIQGKHITLIELVQRKMRKGKTLEIIADELEEPLENVERVCTVVLQCGLDADPQDIYDELQKMVSLDTETDNQQKTLLATEADRKMQYDKIL